MTPTIGLPSYYQFPSNPDGVAFCRIYGDPAPFHNIGDDQVVVFIKSHSPNSPSYCTMLSRKFFEEQYTLDPDDFLYSDESGIEGRGWGDPSDDYPLH